MLRGVAGHGPMIRSRANQRTPYPVGRHLSTLAAQFLHACSDHREIIGGTGPGHLAQFLHARSDCREIIGGAGSGRHVSSVCLSSRVAAIIADAASMAATSPTNRGAPNRRQAGRQHRTGRCRFLRFRIGTRCFAAKAFARTTSSMIQVGSGCRRHQSSLATAGPKLHEREFGGIRGGDH